MYIIDAIGVCGTDLARGDALSVGAIHGEILVLASSEGFCTGLTRKRLAGQSCQKRTSPDQNVALAGEARSAVACAESVHAGGISAGYVPKDIRDRVESRWQVGIQGFFWSEGPEARQKARSRCPPKQAPPPSPSPPACVGAQDVSGVCALAVHFITASKIKLGPDGMGCKQPGRPGRPSGRATHTV